MRPYLLPLSFLFACVFMLQACSVFTSHYDEKRHENFTKLKAMHLKFFDDWTKGSGREWKEQEVMAYCDRGDLTFRETFEYAKSKDERDKTGQTAVKILWDEFDANCTLSLKKKQLFSKVFTDNLLPEIEANYDFAISGETSRLTKK